MVLPRYQKAVANVKGTDEAQKILRDFIAGIDKFTAKEFEQGGKVIVQSASSRTPVDTGRLVSNNKILKVDSKMLVVGNPTPYAKYVHDGTSRMMPRPFFDPPIHEFTRAFPNLTVKDCKQFYAELVRKNQPK